jgi:penicillin-binding protein 1A
MAKSPANPVKAAKPVSKQVQPPRKRWLRILKWAGIVMLAGTALLAATIAFVFWMYGRDPNLPTVDKLRDVLDHPKQVTKVLDMNGDVIGELGSERRTALKFEQIPTIVVDAFIAAEDNNFWEHGGVDYTGMLRAFFANLRAGHTKEGASTITQQVIKMLLLTPEKTFKRKIQEVILARRLEHALTKQEILTLYLNQQDLGDNTFGVQEAAHLYFGKDIKDVNIGEAALLAALPKQPETFYRDLHGGKHPEAAKQRQVYVLDQLVKLGKISEAEAQKWADAPIQIVKTPFGEKGSAPEWVTLARKELVAAKGEESLDTLGGQVRTTLDPGLQAIAQKSLQVGLRTVDKRHKIGRPIRNVKPDKVEAEIARLARALGGEPKSKQVYEAVVTRVDDAGKQLDVDLGHWSAVLELGTEGDERYNPPDDEGKIKAPSERFKPGDVVAVMAVGGNSEQRTGDEDDASARRTKEAKRRVVFVPGPEGAIVIMEVKSRKVRALVGGYASRAGGFDRATMAKRQPGSAFKPFVYATAFAQAATRKCHANDPGEKQLCATPASIVNDAPESYKQWVPKNFESGEYLGAVRLRTALAKSINTVSVHIALDVGPENIVGTAHKMGIQSNLPAEVAVALGADEVTPLELTNAYATFAAGGMYTPPRFIDAIDGKATADAPGEQAISPELAYVVTDLMRSVTIEGTAADVGSKLKITIAGKTGTSNEARNTWFIGMTPDYVIGVWVGYDDNRPMPGEQGARVAAPIFTDIGKQMHLHEKEFTRPAHVVDAVIDRQTGLLAPDGAPKDTTMNEVFIEGTQPVDVAPKPGEVTEGSSVTGEYGD